jgi:uncharacterized protein YbcI
MSSDPLPEPLDGGQVLARVTREIVKLHAAHYGRGPTTARTFWAGDSLVCQMEETLTSVERTLLERGKAEEVHALRRGFQDVMGEEFCAAVEGITGRRVRAFLSQVHLEPDIDVEVFVLEPRRNGGPDEEPRSEDAS